MLVHKEVYYRKVLNGGNGMDTPLTVGLYSRQTSEGSQLDSGFGEGDDDGAILKGKISGMTVTKAACVKSIRRQFKRDIESIRPIADTQVKTGQTKPSYDHPVAIIKYMQKFVTAQNLEEKSTTHLPQPSKTGKESSKIAVPPPKNEQLQKLIKGETQPHPNISTTIADLKDSARTQIENIEKLVTLKKSLTLKLALETQKFQLPDLLGAIVPYYVILENEPKACGYISAGYNYYQDGIPYFLNNADYDLKKRKY